MTEIKVKKKPLHCATCKNFVGMPKDATFTREDVLTGKVLLECKRCIDPLKEEINNDEVA